MKDRVPRILTKLVDGCHKDVKVMEKKYGEVSLSLHVHKCCH